MYHFNIKDFQNTMISWYDENGRILPWRQTNDPYYIWISEIMLQQTQVETVKSYYLRFIQRFPKIKDLAEASLDDVFKMWEGLGYYRRAENLQIAAQTVVNQYQEVFPNTYDEIISLKGIGPYTASAIASIAFQIPKGVVDGNTLRIISRLFNKEDNIAKDQTKKIYQNMMDTLIAGTDPSKFNQGMMDLGAMICTPKNPSCHSCPVAKYCLAFKNDTMELLPVNQKSRKKDEIEFITVFIKYKDKYLFIKNNDGLLKNLYQLVQLEAGTPSEFQKLFFEKYGFTVKLTHFEKTVKHVFTHKIWIMNAYAAIIPQDQNVDIEKKIDQFDELFLISHQQIGDIAIPTAHQKIIKLF